MQHTRLILSLTLIAGLTGCTVGPDYEQPELSMPDIWQAKAAQGIEEREAAAQTWWNALGDPALVELLKRAEAANLDLEIAVARIREARAQHRIAKGEWWPEVNVQGTAST
jgi:outer membrane protein TolC